jgi:hypothetical protein
MNAEQYTSLREMIFPSAPARISVSELINPEQDRTLLYGYTCERETFHVYLKGGQIHKVVYRGSGPASESKLLFHTASESIACESAVPDKRAYPAACDEQFCRLLMSKGQHISFTAFDEREDKAFHGHRVEDLAKAA